MRNSLCTLRILFVHFREDEGNMRSKNKPQRHHKYFPRRDYTTKLEKAFRNHQCNIVMMTAPLHRELHRTVEPPRKPTGRAMQLFLIRHKHCKERGLFHGTDVQSLRYLRETFPDDSR
jgi:hypothetical protein